MRHVAHPTDLTTPPAPLPEGVVPAFSNGSLIDGKYLVEQTLAEGGIGVVILARHLALDQRVAIKYLKPEARKNPAILERFVREGRLAAQIASEHVVRVYDVGVIADGGPYIVMEHLVGEDLGRVVLRGPVPVARAVDYILQACDALAAAHALRIVHRDVKPENLFLAERPSNSSIVKVVDFGISKVAPRRDEEGRWAHETAAGERFGTPLYMSPEQLRSSSNVDPRTDVWSLGVTLHELITGSVPFEGNDLPQLCTSVLTGAPVALTVARPDAPPLLEAIVLRCLEKDPDSRFQNLAELAQELAPFGPPDAEARVVRIKNVIRRAGEIIRAPTPTPGAVEIRPSIIAASLNAGVSGAHAMTTNEQAATVVSARGKLGAGVRYKRGLAWAAGAGALAAVVAAGAVGVAPSSAPRAKVVAAGPVALPSITPPSVVPFESAVAGSTPAPAAAPSSAASNAPAIPMPARTPPATTSKPVRTPSERRRSLFGDRK